MQPGQATQKSDFQTIQRSNGRDWASANRQNTPKAKGAGQLEVVAAQKSEAQGMQNAKAGNWAVVHRSHPIPNNKNDTAPTKLVSAQKDVSISNSFAVLVNECGVDSNQIVAATTTDIEQEDAVGNLQQHERKKTGHQSVQIAVNSSRHADGNFGASTATLNDYKLDHNEKENMEEGWITVACKKTAATQNSIGIEREQHSFQSAGAKLMCTLNTSDVLMNDYPAEAMNAMDMKVESTKPTTVNLTPIGTKMLENFGSNRM